MKTYLIRFGQTNPANYTGLSPTFTVMSNPTGLTTAAAPPGITESPSGSGLYYFGFTATTFPVMFKIDGGATLSATDRFVVGILDPIQAVDEKIGWLSDSQGVSGQGPSTIFGYAKSIGTLQDSFGSTAADPASVLGYLKRNLEVNEGTATFNSASGLWVVLSRNLAAGVTMTPVAFFSHALQNNSGSVTKS